jgi:hypothetical protein
MALRQLAISIEGQHAKLAVDGTRPVTQVW